MHRSLFHLVPLFFCYLFFFAFALPLEPERTVVGLDSTEDQSPQSLQTRGLPYFISPPSPSSPPPPLSLPPPALLPHPSQPQEPPRPPQRPQTQPGNPRPLPPLSLPPPQRPPSQLLSSTEPVAVRFPDIQIFFPQHAGVRNIPERTQHAIDVVRGYLQSSQTPPYESRQLMFRNQYLAPVEDHIHFKVIDFRDGAHCNPSCDGTAFLLDIDGSTSHHGDLIYNGTVPMELLSIFRYLPPPRPRPPPRRPPHRPPYPPPPRSPRRRPPM
ncbi:hypothetical protein DFH05DRAFT_718312 [Lentinula detonsa]|uniref:Uncharacterized protein n=1 Tax=Lentinula detonsa TaxID=2804962 RepID=A0A9W8NQT5_9AGAR|nr:hypothetical protein DFH05DRAFT_718312 [Lentinula detonsa]